MYRNIIFDLGGVMVDWQPEEYLMQRFHNEITETHVFALTFGSDTWRQLDAGEITRFAANAAMMEAARAAGYAFEVQEVIDDWAMMLHTKHRMVEIASRLKSRGFQIFYLSNIAADTLALLKRRGFWRLFDGGIASCDVQLTKPDPRIYKLLTDRYSLDPKECIFIDDTDENMKAAYKYGITCIPMTDSVRVLAKNLAPCGIRLR